MKKILSVLATIALAAILAACAPASPAAPALPLTGGNPTAAPTSAPASPTMVMPTTAATAPSSSAPASGGSDVTIVNFAFSPDALTVKAGTKVTWTNKDTTAHTVTADDGSFDSGPINPGMTFSFTFKQAGTVSYHCSIHPNMKAKIVVTNG